MTGSSYRLNLPMVAPLTLRKVSLMLFAEVFNFLVKGVIDKLTNYFFCNIPTYIFAVVRFAIPTANDLFCLNHHLWFFLFFLGSAEVLCIEDQVWGKILILLHKIGEQTLSRVGAVESPANQAVA